MIVIVSDLHLTDGSSGETINEGAFRIFVEALRTHVYDASFRGEHGQTPTAKPMFHAIERCDLVLLGDVFDVIRSDKWLSSQGDIRPWSAPAKMAQTVDAITQGILTENKQALAHLTDLNGVIEIPDPYVQGRKHQVSLYIHYLVGNHDWFYHLPGGNYDRIRKAVVDGFGLSQSASVPFPHLMKETTKTLHKRLTDHKLHVQHGDIYDAFNYQEEVGRDASSLGDCIVVELLNRFPGEVEKELGLSPSHELIINLREIDNVRPLREIPRWVDSTLDRCAQLVPGGRKNVEKVWDRLVDEFLDNEFVRSLDEAYKLDAVDKLQAGLRLSSALSIRSIADVPSKIVSLFDKGTSYSTCAAEEHAIRKGAAQYVVYGHTHKPEVVPLRLFRDQDALVEQIYFNSGTWRRIHEPCADGSKTLSFTKAHVMTYLAFYEGTERSGRGYETWNGRLG